MVRGFCLDRLEDDARPLALLVLGLEAPFLVAFDVFGRGGENAGRFRFVTAAADVEGMITWRGECNQMYVDVSEW